MTSQSTEYFLKRLINNNSDYIDIIGLNVALLYSKEYFKKNNDISAFLHDVYNISFLPYVMKSRTLIVARITKELNNKDETELNIIRKKLIDYLSNDEADIPKQKETYKRKNSNDKLKSWLEGL